MGILLNTSSTEPAYIARKVATEIRSRVPKKTHPIDRQTENVCARM